MKGLFLLICAIAIYLHLKYQIIAIGKLMTEPDDEDDVFDVLSPVIATVISSLIAAGLVIGTFVSFAGGLHT